MKTLTKLSLSLAFTFCFSAISSQAGTLTVNTSEPTGASVVIANPTSPFTTASPGPLGERETFTQVFNSASAGAGSSGDRGQTFILPATTGNVLWDVSTITLRARSGTFAQDFTANGDASLRMWLFEWNPGNNANDGSQWTTGDGVSDGDPFDGTGVGSFLINNEVYALGGTFSGGEYLHFATPGLSLMPETAYGILFSFDTTGATAQSLRLEVVRDSVTSPFGEAYANGMNIRTQAAANDLVNAEASDDLVFYVQAVPVPEPGTFALLGAGLTLAIFRFRRNQP